MAFADVDALRKAKSIFLDQDMPFADAQTSLELARLGDDPANNLADGTASSAVESTPRPTVDDG